MGQPRPRLLAEIEDVDVIEPLGIRDLDLGMLPLKRGAQVIDGGGVPALADEQPLPIELLEADAGPLGQRMLRRDGHAEGILPQRQEPRRVQKPLGAEGPHQQVDLPPQRRRQGGQAGPVVVVGDHGELKRPVLGPQGFPQVREDLAGVAQRRAYAQNVFLPPGGLFHLKLRLLRQGGQLPAAPPGRRREAGRGGGNQPDHPQAVGLPPGGHLHLL